jgi:hypothetical protein
MLAGCCLNFFQRMPFIDKTTGWRAAHPMGAYHLAAGITGCAKWVSLARQLTTLWFWRQEAAQSGSKLIKSPDA